MRHFHIVDKGQSKQQKLIPLIVQRPRPNPLLADNSQARKSEKGQNSHKGDNAGPAAKLGSTPTGRRGLPHRDAAFDQAPGPLA